MTCLRMTNSRTSCPISKPSRTRVTPCSRATLSHTRRHHVAGDRKWTNIMARILVLNDEADLLEVMAMILSDDGHEVSAISAGRKAFEAALQFGPDLVVMDWRLDGITAEEVVRALR